MLEQAEFGQLPPHVFGHLGQIARFAIDVTRSVLVNQITPALKRPVGPWRNGNNLRLQHQAAPADAIRIRERTNVQQPLTRGNLPFDHPEQGAAVQKLVNTLRHHARGVRLLVNATESLVMSTVLLDPFFEIRDGFAAHAEFDEV